MCALLFKYIMVP
uniref:Uncharacterized protein n=1 Tax=Anguilla anguilla TaxID=7936 RepID=A0A0E9VP97_ANGAN